MVYEELGKYKKAFDLFKDYHTLQSDFFSEMENKIFRTKNAQINQQKAIVERIHEELKDSISYAKVLQETMLPSTRTIRQHLPKSFVFYQPRDLVSGDFFWFTRIAGQQSDKYILAAVDCTGHGVPGAFISIKGEALLQQIVHGRETYHPGAILNQLHQEVKDTLTMEEEYQNDGMDMALCVIEPQQRVVRFAGAKNPLLMVQNGALEEVKGSPYAIGDRFSPEVHFAEKTLEVGENTMLYMFSDGYQDQFGGPEGKKFMKKPFKRLLKRISDQAPKQQEATLAEELEQWRNYQSNEPQEQVDDILVMGFQL